MPPDFVDRGRVPLEPEVDPICATGVVGCPPPASDWTPSGGHPSGDPYWNTPYEMPGTNPLDGLIA
ncbi:hypothetical protein [Nocardia tengchongensis]|uniref:hypothetical protein n=1 Tax=Nocardia tengchongensis TaxID=2055889 RepID=UPI003616A2C1